jgi:hypothetical protein
MRAATKITTKLSALGRIKTRKFSTKKLNEAYSEKALLVAKRKETLKSKSIQSCRIVYEMLV